MRLPDDFTTEEAEIYQYLVNGVDSLVDTSELYEMLNNDLDKFIICYVFEAGNTRVSLQRILKMSKSEVHTRIKNIKADLYKKYRNRKMK